MALTQADRRSNGIASNPSSKSNRRLFSTQGRPIDSSTSYWLFNSATSQSAKFCPAFAQVASFKTIGIGWSGFCSARVIASRANSRRLVVLPEPGGPMISRALWPTSSNNSSMSSSGGRVRLGRSGASNWAVQAPSTASCCSCRTGSRRVKPCSDGSNTPSIQRLRTLASRSRRNFCSGVVGWG